MLSCDVYSLGDPGSFDITDKDDPMYYLARLAHEQSENLYNLNTEGFEFRQDEASDFSTIAGSWNTFGADMNTWFTNAVAASEAGTTVPAIPTLPTLPTDPVTGIVLQILFRVAVSVLGNWLKKILDPDTSAKELTQLLKAALLDSEGNSLFYLLGNTPLEIVLSRIGEYQDFLYSDTPES